MEGWRKMATIVEHGRGWRVQIRRQGNDPISKSGFTTKAEAKAWARAAEAAMDAGRRVEVGKVKFATILAEYRKITANKPHSRSKSASLAMLGHRLGTVILGDITAKRLIAFVAERESEGAGPSTIMMDISYVGTVLRHGAAALDLDPSQALVALASARGALSHADRISRSAERDRRPTEVELLALMSFWRRRPCREIPMPDLVTFACATGMRAGEILRLSWAGLNETKRTMWIRDRKHPRQKRGNDQEVPLIRGPFVLAGQVIDPLQLIKRQDHKGKLIFPYRAASVSTAFTRAVQACEIDDLHFHDLRHHGCSLLFEAGYSIEQVALVSGHRDWNMLRRYTKLRPETLHRDLPANLVPMAAATA
jgi:integrase